MYKTKKLKSPLHHLKCCITPPMVRELLVEKPCCREYKLSSKTVTLTSIS